MKVSQKFLPKLGIEPRTPGQKPNTLPTRLPLHPSLSSTADCIRFGGVFCEYRTSQESLEINQGIQTIDRVGPMFG